MLSGVKRGLQKLNRNNFIPQQMKSSLYMQQMHSQWVKDPQSVHQSWDQYFKSSGNIPSFQNATDSELTTKVISGLYLMIKSFQSRGCEVADIDPLKLDEKAQSQAGYLKNKNLELDFKNYGLTESDLELEVKINNPNSNFLTDIAVFLESRPSWKVKDIIEKLNQIYCGKIGFQFNHITNPAQKKWLRKEIENSNRFNISQQEKLKIFERLCRNESFTEYLKIKFPTAKRFGIEGCDTLISGLGAFVDNAASKKASSVMIGMPHRGRLNTLACVFQKPYEEIFCEFQDIKYNLSEAEKEAQRWGGSGDVKYHLGVTHDKHYKDLNHTIRLDIPPNPSHLETVNPVLMGKVRCVQDFQKDLDGKNNIGVLIHGDAAFAGQGVVYECFQFQNLVDYSVNGIVHIVVNNQIGFTTTPKEARSGLFSTDIAKAVGAPIFHVNADDPQAVQATFKLALDYRNQFKSDCVIDLIGYRKHGHNELDQPSFTQPLMYNVIEKMVPIYKLYSQKLIQEGVLTEEQRKKEEEKNLDILDKAFNKSREQNIIKGTWQQHEWESMKPIKLDEITPKGQGVNLDYLQNLSSRINNLPQDFNANDQIKKLYQAREKSVSSGVGLDFATAEALAFGSLLEEGYGVRLSGQDVERGTFSHRHALIHDQKVNRRYVPLLSILPAEQQHRFMISNSHLSEYGVLGYEYGYSLQNPNVLVMWEAQFGDFANGAQAIIDNYLASAESKWGCQSGLTLLLPHGMDGQGYISHINVKQNLLGPEHSSARMERFLQLMDDPEYIPDPTSQQVLKQQIVESNMQIVQCTTSANYFFALRRQMRRNFRKPLICFNSKKLLRLKNACSNLQEFEQGNIFHRVYPETQAETLVQPKDIKKVVICSGQVFYDIIEKRKKDQVNDVAIIRIEQIAPFPYNQLNEALKPYKNADVIFCQEEQHNYGPWFYVQPRIDNVLTQLARQENFKQQQVRYVGRSFSGSPAAGSSKKHNFELNEFLEKLFA